MPAQSRSAATRFTLTSPHQAQQLGVSIIYQEFNLFPNLSVEENIFIGREPGRVGMVDRRTLRNGTRQLLDRLGVQLDPGAPVSDLSVAQQQMVEIAKALSYNARIVIMDEPTSALTDNEVTALFRIIRELRDAEPRRDLHLAPDRGGRRDLRPDHCPARRPQRRRDRDRGDATPSRIVQMMVGRPLSDLFQKEARRGRRRSGAGSRRAVPRQIEVATPSSTSIHDISLSIQAGEIVGLAGLVGSGRTELARAIFGADQIDRGTIKVNGKTVSIKHPLDAIELGIGLVPEDRKQQALVLSFAGAREHQPGQSRLADIRRLHSAWRRAIGGPAFHRHRSRFERRAWSRR